MTAHATTKDDMSSDELERNLAEEIARAMQRKPLMGRLAGTTSADGGRSGEETFGGPAPPSIDQLMEEDFGEPVTTPASTAEWLGKARRERNRARVSNAVAWLATLVIGGAIISATVLLLPQ
jgi:hypothetical protein